MIDQALQVFKKEVYHKTTLIGEFSGRDSVAAILKAFEYEDVDYILPIATFAGTEYGDFNVIYENFLKLKEMIAKKYKGKKILYPLYEYSRPDLWHLMNGRKVTQLNEKYNFYNPCISCHLYFHLTKIPFAKELSKRIISGERASHDGRIKINQLPESLKAYRESLLALGYELMMPIENMSGREIEELIDWEWPEGDLHPKCVLSGNYRDNKGKASYDPPELDYFLNTHIAIIGTAIGKYLSGDTTESEMKQEVEQLI